MRPTAILCFVVAVPALASAAQLQDSAANYPTKPIRMIVGFPAGGVSDNIARLVGQKMSEAWGQQVVMDNRPGAGGIISMEMAARRPRTAEQVPRALARGCDPGAGCGAES